VMIIIAAVQPGTCEVIDSVVVRARSSPPRTVWRHEGVAADGTDVAPAMHHTIHQDG